MALPACTAFWGLFTKKPRWSLSWKGWIVCLTGLLLALVVLFRSVHLFLAVTDRVPANVLVVEGWVPDTVLKAAVIEYSTGHYQLLLVAIPWPSPPRTNSFVRPPTAPARFLKSNIPRGVIHDIYLNGSKQDRTYHTALAVHAWLAESSFRAEGINVLTEDAHARRTRLLYRRAFPAEIKVGVIAAPPEGYEPSQWWKTSEGCKEMLGETIGYTYARFFSWLTPESSVNL